MAKKKAATKSKRATKAANTNEPETRDPHAVLSGAPVFVRWDIGRYKLGICDGFTPSGDPKVRIAMVDPKGRYTGVIGKELRVFKPGEVSRVYSFRDWESIGVRSATDAGDDAYDVTKGETAAQHDARMARGPATDGLQRRRAQLPIAPGVHGLDIEDVEMIADAILNERTVTARELRSFANWTLHCAKMCETWKEKYNALEEKCDALEEEDSYSRRSKLVQRDDIVNVKASGKQWERARVTLVDAHDMHFVTVDDNGGSRPLIEHGKTWSVDAENDRGGGQALTRFHEAASLWTKDHEAKKRTRIPTVVAVPPRADTSAQHMNTGEGHQARIEQSTGAKLGVPASSSTPVPPSSSTPEKKNGESYHPDPKAAAVGRVINVKVGRRWEGVRVTKQDAERIYFEDNVGVEGSRTHAERGKEWYVPYSNVVNGAPSTDALALAAEKERAKVDRQGQRALAKAAKPEKPMRKAIANGEADVTESGVTVVEDSFAEDGPSCGAIGPDGTSCVIDAGHGATTPKNAAIQHCGADGKVWKERRKRGSRTKESPVDAAARQAAVDERQRADELDHPAPFASAPPTPEELEAREANARMMGISSPVPDAPDMDDEERQLATPRELEHVGDSWETRAESGALPWD